MRTVHLAPMLLLLAACATSGANRSSEAWAGSPGEPIVKADDVAGFWTGDWGNLILRQYGEAIWGAYGHRDGTLVGRLVDGVLVGWWTEEPSRAPDSDAGELELRLVKRGEELHLLGRYRQGSAGAWHEEGWDLRRVADAPPPELERRFADVGLFHPHP